VVSAARVLVGACPSVVEVAVLHVPAGAVAVVEHPYGVREYEPELRDVEAWAVVPGSPDTLGWHPLPSWYYTLAGIRNGRLKLDRQAWHTAAKLLRSEPVIYVRHEKQLYFGSWRWTAVSASTVSITDQVEVAS
jgi:hypothetical protein